MAVLNLSEVRFLPGRCSRLFVVYFVVLLVVVLWFFFDGPDSRIPAGGGKSNIWWGQKKNAVASSLQNDYYAPYALVLGYTVQKYNPIFADGSTDLILLVPYDNDISEDSKSRLETIGWQIRYEYDIDIPGAEVLNQNFQRNFIKFRVWNWTEYRKVALFDADTMVMGDISLLLSDGFDFGAVPDTWPNAMPALNFNAGVLSLTPSAETYSALLNYSLSNPLTEYGEQDILNNFFPAPNPGPFYPSAYTRLVLPMKYNLNVEAHNSHQDQWDDLWPDGRAIHFTMTKPLRDAWRCVPDPNCTSIQSLRRWIDEDKEMRSKYDWEKLWDF